jgi:hypothetical protein
MSIEAELRTLPLETRRAARPWPVLPVMLAFALCWLVLGWPWLSGRVTIPWDAKAHFQPQIQFLAQSLAAGESPFWAPYVFSGHPQIADPQSLIFSPPFLILALLNGAPSSRAVDATVLAAILVGALALVLWVRDRGWHWAGALISALAFGFGAAMAWRIQHIGQVLSLAYLPIVLLLLGRALDRGSLGYGFAAGVVAGFLVLGRDQVALLAVYLLAAIVLMRVLRDKEPPVYAIRRSLAPLSAGALGGLLTVTMPVLLTALVAAESNRPSIDLVGAGRGSLHPALLLTLFAPDLFGSSGEMEKYWGPPSFTWHDTGLYIAQNVGQLYIGAVPVLLVLLGAAGRLYEAREIRVYAVALLLLTVYALGWYTPVFRLVHAALPGVDLFRRPADAVFLIGFLLALLAGYTAHRLFTGSFEPKRGAVLVAAAVTLAAFGYGLHLAFHFDRLERAAAPVAIAAALVTAGALALAAAQRLIPTSPRLAAALLLAYTVGDLAWSNGPGSATALPPEHYEVLQPDSRNATIGLLARKVAESTDATHRPRIELAGLGFHWPNASLTHRLENTLGYNPVRLGLYTRATGAGDHIGQPGDRRFSPLFPSYRSPLANLLGLRFIAAGAPLEDIDKGVNPGEFPLIARTADAYVYENPHALPRVLFATQSAPADFERMLEKGGWPEVDFARTVLLEGSPRQGPERPHGSVRIASYRNTEVVLEANSPAGGWVVLNDIWHPWWAVTIDGRAAPLLRANVLFRAVEVPAGRHEIRFVFRPVRGALTGLTAVLGGQWGARP